MMVWFHESKGMTKRTDVAAVLGVFDHLYLRPDIRFDLIEGVLYVRRTRWPIAGGHDDLNFTRHDAIVHHALDVVIGRASNANTMPTITENDSPGATVVDISEAKKVDATAPVSVPATGIKVPPIDIDHPTGWAQLFAGKAIARAKRLRAKRLGVAEREAEQQRARAEAKEVARVARAIKQEAARAERERIRIEAVAKRAALRADTLIKLEEARASNGSVREGIVQRKPAPSQGSIPRPNMPHPDVRDVQETFRATYEEHCRLVAEALKAKTVDGIQFRSMSSYFRVKLGLPA